jgi:hypothetical protein
MKIARVEYTVTVTGEDGKTVSVNKERILSELDSIDPKHIHQVLEQELQETEEPPPGKTITDSSFVVTNITELHPTGDDDQITARGKHPWLFPCRNEHHGTPPHWGRRPDVVPQCFVPFLSELSNRNFLRRLSSPHRHSQLF